MNDEELIERLLYGVCQDQYDDVEIYETEQLMKKAAERICALHEQLAAALRDVYLERRTKWQPIETAPRDGTEVIGAWQCLNKTWDMNKVAFHTDSWWSHYMDSYHEPTHWMPLPEPPHA